MDNVMTAGRLPAMKQEIKMTFQGKMDQRKERQGEKSGKKSVRNIKKNKVGELKQIRYNVERRTGIAMVETCINPGCQEWISMEYSGA